VLDLDYVGERAVVEGDAQRDEQQAHDDEAHAGYAVPDLLWHLLPRHSDAGGRTPDGDAEHQVQDVDGHDRGPHRPAHGHTDAGGTAGGVIAVVAVDQHDDHR